jgi:hypothetical protein
MDRLSNLQGLARLCWMFLGPGILFLILMGVATRGGPALGAIDAACLVVTLVMLAARGYEFQQGTAQTSTGELATPADWHRFLVFTPLVVLALWGTAKIMALFLQDPAP